MTEDDIGKYFIDSEGVVWRMVTYSSRPTVKMQKLGDDKVVKHAAVGSLLLGDMVKLDDAAQENIARVMGQIDAHKFKSKRPKIDNGE